MGKGDAVASGGSSTDYFLWPFQSPRACESSLSLVCREFRRCSSNYNIPKLKLFASNSTCDRSGLTRFAVDTLVHCPRLFCSSLISPARGSNAQNCPLPTRASSPPGRQQRPRSSVRSSLRRTPRERPSPPERLPRDASPRRSFRPLCIARKTLLFEFQISNRHPDTEPEHRAPCGIQRGARQAPVPTRPLPRPAANRRRGVWQLPQRPRGRAPHTRGTEAHSRRTVPDHRGDLGHVPLAARGPEYLNHNPD